MAECEGERHGAHTGDHRADGDREGALAEVRSALRSGVDERQDWGGGHEEALGEAETGSGGPVPRRLHPARMADNPPKW
ncbi:hypothetical protein GCM10009869_25890 [Amnibacterium kyonggiense]